jgi:ADP-dependent NAD(P)H-hydrate dehydratase
MHVRHRLHHGMPMADDLLPALPPRPDRAHKGSFGTVLVVAGQATMIGAPSFVALGALRSGCGLVRLAAPEGILTACLTLVPSAIGVVRSDDHAALLSGVDDATVIAAGPGLGLGSGEQALVAALLQSRHRLVLDGDGLTLLARLGCGARPQQAPLVITPHPGEYAHLAAVWGTAALPAAADDDARRAACRELASATGAVVVLKGHHTVVSAGDLTWTCRVGNPALSIPGSGDVLSGVIASLMAQGLAGAPAACAGVQLHGLAGDLWAATRPFGLLASELAALIPEAARSYRREPASSDAAGRSG